VNGAAAHKAQVGDLLIIASYAGGSKRLVKSTKVCWNGTIGNGAILKNGLTQNLTTRKSRLDFREWCSST
jgi:hypothetical protein